MTGEAPLASGAEGQSKSLKPTGRALRMVAVSRCRRLPRPLIVIPSSRTRLPRKLITIGAAIVISVDIAPERRPDSELSPLVMALVELPKRLDSRVLPMDITGELGSET